MSFVLALVGPCVWPRDRVKATFSESQDWETEEKGVDMDFNMHEPLEGLIFL